MRNLMRKEPTENGCCVEAVWVLADRPLIREMGISSVLKTCPVYFFEALLYEKLTPSMKILSVDSRIEFYIFVGSEYTFSSGS